MAKEAKPIEPIRPKRPKPTFVGEPARACGNCQHWGPNKLKNGKPRHRACHNGISQRYESTERDSCDYGFYPDVKRFPLEERYHAT